MQKTELVELLQREAQHNQLLDCVISTAELSLCIISGEPHYRTFDKQIINYQGICKHLLVKPTFGYNGTNTFQVYLRNEYRGGNTQVSFPKDVIIDLCSDHVEMLHDATSTDAAVPVIVQVRTKAINGTERKRVSRI
jgi:hypothetical protein